MHAGWLNPSLIRRAETTFGRLARPYLPVRGGAGPGDRPARPLGDGRWRYLSLDEPSGYGVAADRCRTALEASGLEVEWTPFVVGGGVGPRLSAAGAGSTRSSGPLTPCRRLRWSSPTWSPSTSRSCASASRTPSWSVTPSGRPIVSPTTGSRAWTRPT